METLLEEDYIQHYNLTGTYVTFHSTGQGQMSFHDEKACRECELNNVKICDGQTDKQVFIVNTISEIHKIEIENYFNQFGRETSASPKERCDLLLYDDRKIVFADMFCGQEKYAHPYTNQSGVQSGKIAKVRNQINSTVNKLREVPSINTKIANHPLRVGIFAARYKPSPIAQQDEADSAMMTFLEADQECNKEDRFSFLTCGFAFVTVTYPTPYSW